MDFAASSHLGICLICRIFIGPGCQAYRRRKEGRRQSHRLQFDGVQYSDGIAAGFKKKTGLEMEYWRGSSTKVLDRALNEHRAGKPLFDVAITIADPMFLMQREGVFAKYMASVTSASEGAVTVARL